MKLIKNIALYDGDKYLENACVLIDGQTIVYAGAADRCPGGQGAQVIDGRGGLCMPGFYNAHSHAPMTLLRGVGSDLRLMDWLGQIFPIEDKMTDEIVYWGTMLAIMEMLRTGTVAFADQYFLMDNVAQAAADTGIRVNLSRGCTNREGIDSVTGLYKRWHGAKNGRIKVYMGIHAEYTTTPETVEYGVAAAEALNTGLHVHISETRGEVEGCIERHGVTPVRYFFEKGAYKRTTIAAHCVHATDEDIEILAESGVYAAHNPASNMKLASGVAPVSKMLARGVRVALGTDGASSNNALDMMADMRLASLLQKGTSLDPTLLTVSEALHMATRMGARAMGFEDAGLLKNGMKADLIILDTNAENLTPWIDPLANLVYSAKSSNICLTMVDGEILYQDGAFKTLDAARVVAKATECARVLGILK